MKHIEWHNPAQQTPPKGYRLLIPIEVDGRFSSSKLPTVQYYSPSLRGWDGEGVTVAGDITDYSYAVPSDTPLPEGYALIDGQVWRRIVEQAPEPYGAGAFEMQSRHEEFVENFKASVRKVLEDHAKHIRLNMQASIDLLRNDNQRLKCELADARATLKSIKSLIP
jgi:hypothetical protein